MKAWHRYQRSTGERPKPKGFTLEALVAHYQDRDAPSFAEQFVNFLDNLSRACGLLLSAGIFPVVPDPAMPRRAIALTISEEEAHRFGQLVTTTLADARAALDFSGVAVTVCAWRVIFGPSFPEHRSASIKLVESIGLIDDELGEQTEDITDIGLPRQLPLGKVRLSAQTAMTQGGQLKSNYPSNG